MSEHSTTAFFDVWHTYRKVVAANYMHHVEIKAHIEQMLHAQFVGRPFSFLDLGCGDAASLAPLLATMAVKRYKGVDLSETALALAAENLKTLSCPVELVCRDILVALEADSGLYDVVYTSFALHHLSTEQKAEFFRLAAQRLAKDGLLLLTDIVREEDEVARRNPSRARRHRAGPWRLAQQPNGSGDDRTFVCRLRHPDDIAALLEPADCVSRGHGGCVWTCLRTLKGLPARPHSPANP